MANQFRLLVQLFYYVGMDLVRLFWNIRHSAVKKQSTLQSKTRYMHVHWSANILCHSVNHVRLRKLFIFSSKFTLWCVWFGEWIVEQTTKTIIPN